MVTVILVLRPGCLIWYVIQSLQIRETSQVRPNYKKRNKDLLCIIRILEIYIKFDDIIR